MGLGACSVVDLTAFKTEYVNADDALLMEILHTKSYMYST